MKLKNKTSKKRMEKMPNFTFKMMTLMFKIFDFFKPVENFIDTIDIKKGDTVIDYGCGPGRYIKKASENVGDNGKVYAVDVHELAIRAVQNKEKKYNLYNVIPILADEYSCNIEDNVADLIYTLDMFHIIKEPSPFLHELKRLVKKEGILIIEDGHQSRKKSKEKIEKSQTWKIINETDRYLKCKPIK